MRLADYFVENEGLRRQWAGDLNDKPPSALTHHSRARVWWRCERGHEWQATVDSRVNRGRGCPCCAGQSVLPGVNDIAAAAPDMAKLWHPTRNGALKPSDITPGSGRKLWWQCGRGHEWQAAAYSVKAGTSCPYCSGRNPIPGQTDLATTHPHLLHGWSAKNQLSPTQVTAGSHKKIWWVCGKGHEWEAPVDSVTIMGSGCPYCAGKRAVPGETDLATVRPDILAEWDYEKNTAAPEELLPSSHDKVWWKCALGHSWQAMVFSRTREQSAGCPYCTGRRVLRGFNDLATLKPKLADEWHQPLNGTLRPEDVTLGSNKKVWWKCSDGHVWQAFIYARTKPNGTGCPVCAGQAKRSGSSIAELPQQKKYAQPRKTKKEQLVGSYA